MKQEILVGAGLLIAAVLVATGCQSQSGKTPSARLSSTGNDVTDIHPSAHKPALFAPVDPTPMTPAMSATPAPSPVTFATPAPSTEQPVMLAATSNTHVVRHGETFYSIARTNYGDGKQWTRIASANPGVSPSALKTGQTIVIP